MDKAKQDRLRRGRRYRSLALATRILSRVCLTLFVLLLLLLIFPSFTDVSRVPLFRWVNWIENGLSSLIRLFIHLKAGNTDLSPWLATLVTLALSQLCARLSERFTDMGRYLRFQSEYDVWKKDKNLEDNAAVLSPVNEVLEQLKTGKLKDREQLLKIFAETQRKLDEISTLQTFLSMDVVDSTGMKVGEEKVAVEYDFREYRKFVEAKLQAHGSRQTVWTPDGSMSCFASAHQAVGAAQDLIGDLEYFNRNVKTMRRDFRVRCGINTGTVYLDDNRRLEEVTDRVLDIAAHFQKNAPPNGIYVTRTTVEALQNRSDFTATGQVIQANEVYEWQQPRSVPHPLPDLAIDAVT